MSIDLHSHTLHSDGLLTPTELVRLALRRGVRVLALTDHDTVSGLGEASTAALGEGLCLVPGIEITAGLHGREVHVLGHFIEPDSPRLVAFCASMREEREGRIHRMLAALARVGIVISYEEVAKESGGGTLGRPHLARAMLARGVVGHLQEAFERYLGPGKPGWVERIRPDTEEAIALIHEAGGTASLAHPGADSVSRQELKVLAAQGLDAVEAHHPSHPPSQREAYVRWGRALGLLATGGSDFHGPESELSHPGLLSASESDFEGLRGKSRRGS